VFCAGTSDEPDADEDQLVIEKNPVMTQPVQEQEIEGVDEERGRSWGDYPIDNLLIQTRHLSVREAVGKITRGGFVLNPDFQREFVWPDEKQSRLIESVLMRIPLPVFYLAEDEEGRYVVVDGLQRLTTFKRFLNGELTLKLSDRPELDGLTCSELTPKLQNRLEDSDLTLYILDSKAPERARLDIFERVNGGVPLTRQQMRNCLFMGAATLFLKEEAVTQLFRDATGDSLKSLTMQDREFVNRFCAFKLLPHESYRDDIDEFLARALKTMNKLPMDQLELLRASLRRSLENNVNTFGKHAFRKHTPDRPKRSILNLALFDVMSVILADYEPADVIGRKAQVAEAFFRLMRDTEFIDAITYGTNTATKVRTRFAKARASFEEVLGDPPNRA
jgi:hypothetical protein